MVEVLGEPMAGKAVFGALFRRVANVVPGNFLIFGFLFDFIVSSNVFALVA